MKKIIFIFLLLLSVLPSRADLKKLEGNPINIAFMLAQNENSDKIESILSYYGYEPQNANDGYTIYMHTNGSVIKYTFKDSSEEQPYPVVEVKSNSSSKEIDTILTDLRFEKDGSGYLRKLSRYARTSVSCIHGSHGFLVFHQKKLPRQE